MMKRFGFCLFAFMSFGLSIQSASETSGVLQDLYDVGLVCSEDTIYFDVFIKERRPGVRGAELARYTYGGGRVVKIDSQVFFTNLLTGESERVSSPRDYIELVLKSYEHERRSGELYLVSPDEERVVRFEKITDFFLYLTSDLTVSLRELHNQLNPDALEQLRAEQREEIQALAPYDGVRPVSPSLLNQK